MTRRPFNLHELHQGVIAGDRTALSRAITLVESEAAVDLPRANALLDLCRGAASNAIRVGITGVPGVGKSTFIEALGLQLVNDLGKRIVVLAIDPSSTRSGGSILGDKSRMPKLAAHPGAFIRPSPSRTSLGGVTTRTRETLLVCEAAGYDVAIIETVGVGQSETAVHEMVDAFLLLALAGAGDELQGMKRGIMEMADVIAITKSDGENEGRASLAAAQIRQALHLYPPGPAGWAPPVVLTSALTGQGIVDVWHDVVRFTQSMRTCGAFDSRRADQRVRWFEEESKRLVLLEAVRPEVSAQLDMLRAAVLAGGLSPWSAAHLAAKLLGGTP